MDVMQQKLRELEDMMVKETRKLESLAERETRLRNAVLEKNWDDLEPTIRSLTSLSREIEHIENSRDILYSEIRVHYGVTETEGFHDFLAKLGPENRGTMAESYRRLRFIVGEVKSASEGIDAYVGSAMTTLRRILEELFPSRRMRLYTKSGTTRKTDQPLVINRSL